MRKVLVANRGEIACRIIRACRELNLASVAVYSDADAGSLHVALADEAVRLGPAPARESYLRADLVLAAARDTGCDGLHPGYGFHAESASFAKATIDAGLTWIGPAPATIAAMGDKQSARRLAEAAGLPVAPGTPRLEPGDALTAATDVGFPLLVKAAAGGGGIGMRRVETADDLPAAIDAVRTAGGRYFGDEGVYLERLISPARHVEVQIFGDGTGGAIHLFERDCSTQRRFQKLIEETPAPGLSQALRSGLADAAVALARAQAYSGPGTVEFLVDVETEGFYFLEMNTRIQVEHTVTEMVTGLDLVALQIRQAYGQLPPLAQADVSLTGHAIECRICAEDPQAGFRPSVGEISALAFPSPSQDVRVDTGYRAGDRVTPYYDSLVAKVVVHGADREEARKRMLGALRQTAIEGVKTNVAFLSRLMEHSRFAHGALDVAWISGLETPPA